MPISNVPVGGVARAIHVQQILNWLRGNPTYSEPVNFTGINSSVAYALTVLNLDAAGKGLLVKDSSSNVELFGVRNSGVTVKPVTAGVSAFRVRNLTDTDNIFEVTDTGVSIGGVSPVTLTGVQTLTNKTLTSPVVSGIRTTDFMDMAKQSSAPAAPDATGNGNIRFYGVTTDELPRYKGSTGAAEKILVDTDSVQSLTNKTLTAPTLAGPILTTFSELVTQASAPTAPSAGRVRLYGLTSDGLIKFIDSSSTIHHLVTTSATQTLTGKSLTSPTLTGPVVSDDIEIVQIATPAAPAAGRATIYSKTGTNFLHYRTNTSGEKTLVDTDSTQTLAGKTLTSPVLTGPVVSDVVEIIQVATPSAPVAGRNAIYSKVGTDLVHYRTNTSGEKTLVDTDSAQTLSNKTLTSPTITGLSLNAAVIANYEDFVEVGANPGDPGAGKLRVWAKTDNNLYITMPGGVPTVIHTSSNTPATGTSLARAISLGGL